MPLLHRASHSPLLRPKGLHVWHLAQCGLSAAVALLACVAAHAQGGVPLITVATDQSSLNLSDQFGIPAGTAINQAGDFAFVGNGDTALFWRPAGASTATRLLQIDDEAPGFPGSQISSFFPELGLNSATPRVLLFGVRFTGADRALRAALMTYDGTNYHTLVSSDQIAPDPSGAPYGPDLLPGSVDDAGDINFAAISTTSDPIPAVSTTFYILPSGAATAVRVVGSNDPPPPGCPLCTSGIPPLGASLYLGGTPTGVGVLVGATVRPSVPPLNALGQMLIGRWGGLFIASKDGTLKLVPMANSGACSSQTPTTGTGLILGVAAGAFLNNAGAVAFTNPPNSSSAAICVAAADGSAASPAVSSGDSAPASVGGGTIGSPVALGFDDSGDIVFDAEISGKQPYHVRGGAP